MASVLRILDAANVMSRVHRRWNAQDVCPNIPEDSSPTGRLPRMIQGRCRAPVIAELGRLQGKLAIRVPAVHTGDGEPKGVRGDLRAIEPMS